MQLSEKLKAFSLFFIVFSGSPLNLDVFGKKWASQIKYF